MEKQETPSGILANCFSKRQKPNKYFFGNQTKFSIFLRNNRDCMVEDPYKARKSWSSRIQVLYRIIFLQRKFSIFLRNDRDSKVFIQNQLSRLNQKTSTTAQLYSTLSTYVTPKTISRQNKKKKKIWIEQESLYKINFPATTTKMTQPHNCFVL